MEGWDDRSHLHGTPASLEPATPRRKPADAGDDPARVDRFADAMYDLLRRGAGKTVRQELRGSWRAGYGGTSLLHDAYIRIRQTGLVCPSGVDEERYCWGAFVIAMRRLLVERARRRVAQSTRSGARGLDEVIEPLAGVDEPAPEDTLRLERAIRRLLVENAALYEVFALRHFAGLSREEVARLRGARVEEVKRQLEVARGRLRTLVELSEREEMDPRPVRTAAIARSPERWPREPGDAGR